MNYAVAYDTENYISLSRKKPEQDAFCLYCGKKLHWGNFSIEHIIPKSRYGNNSEHNKRPCCVPCNGQKGNLLPQEYLSYINRQYERAKTDADRYELQIKIYNIEHVIEYVKSAGEKLLLNGRAVPKPKIMVGCF